VTRPNAILGLVAAVVLAGCSSTGDSGTTSQELPTPTTPTGGPPSVVEVRADGETQPSGHHGDSVDDPAIWVDKTHPAQSLVIGNDKQGALLTYGLDGSLVQRITAPDDFWGNVDVRQDVPLPSGPTDVVAVANSALRLYTVDPETRHLIPITEGGESLNTEGGEGLCLYDSPDGDLSVFMISISGATRQFAIHDDGSGLLTIEKVREFEVGSEAEGCVVDDENRALYVSEEDVGLWKYDADPSGGDTRERVEGLVPEGHLIPDVEGVTLVDDGDGRGLIIASAQAPTGESSYFSVFDRGTGAYRSSFRIADGKHADGCSHTDGVAATSSPLGPGFPQGLFVCQDDKNTAPGQAGNQDFKLTRLEKVRP